MSKQQFIQEWFDHPDWWFNADVNVDTYLTETYQHLLYDAEPYHQTNPLHDVIVYDQLPRHVYRNQSANHVILFYLEKALKTLRQVDTAKLNNEEWCFAMLPIRHKQDTVGIFDVVSQAWKRMSCDHGCIVRRFLKAAYERCPTGDQTRHIVLHENKNSWKVEKHSRILHYAPSHPRVPVNDNHPLVKEVVGHVRNLSAKHITMSLSGGVDSMVCLHILDGIRHQFGLHIHVVHINYTNRSTAYDEEAFVVDWATSQGYAVCVRRIEEIKREPCMQNDLRNVYEAYTRNVRYGTYKTVHKCAPVVLGHNRDDCLENIFTNIAHQGKYDNLLGMRTVTEQDGICFFRPLLNVTKEDIIRYARDHNIPYLPNSTPTWSQRGQIRSKIVPCLDSWNASFVPGLFSLSHVLEDVSKLVEDQVRMYLKNVRSTHTSKAFDFDDKSCIPDSKAFWSVFVFKLCGIHTSTKSLDNFLERLSKFKKTNSFDPVRIELKKSIQVTLKHHRDRIEMSFVHS